MPDLGIDETRSRSWKTRLLAPAAFIATVYNPDSPDTEDPTGDGKRKVKFIKQQAWPAKNQTIKYKFTQ